MTPREAREELWRRGSLDWKLRPHQKRISALIDDTLAKPDGGRKVSVHVTRRGGKSFCLCLKATSICIRKPGAVVHYIAPTQRELRRFIHPIITTIHLDCPEDMKPKWKSLDGCYEYPNGSRLYVLGANQGHEDDARGSSSDFCFIDEAGFIDRLEYLVNSVMMPQLITTGGMLVLSSSSPLTSDHEFVEFIKQAEQKGTYIRYTIHDCQLEPDLIQEFCEEAGGENSTTWKREYLCELVTDEERQIIPEWKQEYKQEFLLTDFHKFYHRYVSMDIGFKDFTAILFAHYDFSRAVLYIEDEIVLAGKAVTTVNIRDEIKKKEAELWTKIPVYKRIADNNNPIFLQDLASFSRFAGEEGIGFVPTTKDNLEAMVNEVRNWTKQGRIIVNPKCKQLLGCLQYGIWDPQRKQFASSKVYGHYDALAALMYLVRNVSVHSNPVPAYYVVPKEDWSLKEDKDRNLSNTAKALKKMWSVSGRHN